MFQKITLGNFFCNCQLFLMGILIANCSEVCMWMCCVPSHVGALSAPEVLCDDLCSLGPVHLGLLCYTLLNLSLQGGWRAQLWLEDAFGHSSAGGAVWRAAAREMFWWLTTLQMKGVIPCDIKNFIFEKVIQRLSASQTNKVKYI